MELTFFFGVECIVKGSGKMRRLAKNVREDAYGSSRDYQDIVKEEAVLYQLDDHNQLTITFDNEKNDSEFVGLGGYVKVEEEIQLDCIVENEAGEIVAGKKINIPTHWKRFGVAWSNSIDSSIYRIKITSGSNKILFYSLQVSGFDRIVESDQDTLDLLKRLNANHMAPESFYLNSDTKVKIEGMDTTENVSDAIDLKKCSYCQRYMLVGQNDSSFHKHKSKKSGFQNECRSCKALRINDSLNQLRTVDQLNESGVITREKKILLREPEILAEIKNRHSGEGLKSLTWKKFNKKCFRCDNKKLLLNEVQLDHTRPLAYLWPLDEYATCLCANCNNSKHDQFPVDFYTELQLIKLSEIVGLSLDELKRKEVNEEELSNILNDIELYYDNLEWKTFKSIRNKVIELNPEIDLYQVLKQQSETKYEELNRRLTQREEE